MLKINEIFKSIQGESSYAGLPCVFVRLTGCHLRCVYCDTEHAFYEGFDLTVKEAIKRVKALGVPFVEMTGGEPLLQKDAFILAKELVENGFTVLVETSGAVDIQSLDTRVIKIIDIKCPSSNMSDKMIWSNLKYLNEKDEVKFVMSDRADFDWASTLVKKHNLKNVLFSPVFEKLQPQILSEWILKENLPVRLQLQLHKIIWDPAMRGV